MVGTVIKIRVSTSAARIRHACTTAYKNGLWRKDGHMRSWLQDSEHVEKAVLALAQEMPIGAAILYDDEHVEKAVLALDEEMPIGAAILYDDDPNWPFSKLSLSVYVKRNYRRKGIGSLLIKKVISGRRKDEVIIDTSGYRYSFYLRNGFAKR